MTNTTLTKLDLSGDDKIEKNEMKKQKQKQELK